MVDWLDHVLTSESVASGHPDKVCDSISDAIVDACISIDPNARVAVETLVKGTEGKSIIVLAGEVSLDGDAPDYETIARKTAADIGYTDHAIGMDATSTSLCDVQLHITTQSAYISQGVDGDDIDSQGAGDQGMMFGYACNETEQDEELRGRYFPIAAALAQRLTRRLDDIQSKTSWMRPDGKSQVSVRYDPRDDTPQHVDTVVIAVQHAPDMLQEDIKKFVWDKVVKVAIPPRWLTNSTQLIVNGTGSFPDPGGPYSDAGITGRKIVVDAYGGAARHGGGAFSGKDPSKVDRSAAYYARWVAKHVIAAGLADRCEIQVAYVIGQAEPVSLQVRTFGTHNHVPGPMPDQYLSNLVLSTFDWRPAAIIRELDLRHDIYLPTSTGGHFGRKPKNGLFPWEDINPERIEALTTARRYTMMGLRWEFPEEDINLNLIKSGKSYEEIANELGERSPEAIKKHMAPILLERDVPV